MTSCDKELESILRVLVMKNKRLNSCNDERTYSTSSSIQKKTKAFSARTKYFFTHFGKEGLLKRFRDKEKQKNNFFGT